MPLDEKRMMLVVIKDLIRLWYTRRPVYKSSVESKRPFLRPPIHNQHHFAELTESVSGALASEDEPHIYGQTERSHKPCHETVLRSN